MALILAMPLLVFAQYERPGSSGVQFLDIGVDARAEAMSGANISAVSGVAGVYYNPAAIAINLWLYQYRCQDVPQWPYP